MKKRKMKIQRTEASSMAHIPKSNDNINSDTFA